MNLAVKNMFRNRRQSEGRRPTEPDYPPNLEGQHVHAGFAYQKKVEHEQRANLLVPPAYEIDALDELPTAHQYTGESLDASLPIDSNFYDAQNKIRPWAHVRVPTYLAISEWEGGADDEFLFGKMAAQGIRVPQQVGGQASIDVNPLIPEADYTTFGAMNTLVPQYEDTEDGYIYA
jgi:hypothetical protein